MDNIYFTREEFNKLWNKLEYLGRGGEGICKRLNNKEIIKYLTNEKTANKVINSVYYKG